MAISCTRDFDTVELVMRIEDCFGIVIPDQDAERILTVGELFAYVRQRIDIGFSTECLTAQSFYLLRRTLMGMLKCDRKAISPATRVSELLPPATRRAQWAELGQALGLRSGFMSLLQRPVAVVTALVAVTLVLFAVGGVGLLLHRLWLPLIFFPLGFAFALAGYHLTKPLAIETRRYSTVGSLTTLVLGWKFSEFAPRGASDQQVWEVLVGTICDTLGMEKSQITPELRFADIEPPW